MSFDWKNNNALKNCSICGQPVERKGNAITVGLCPEHSRIWREDIEFGLSKRNRLRDIMVERGQTPENQT
jgi:hypothetical protein